MWKLQILLYSFLIPKEFSLDIGVLSLSPYRFLLILFAPLVITQLLLKRKFQWQAFDSLVLMVCVWPTFALIFNTGFLPAIESGGSIFLETFVPFFIARLTIYKYENLASISKTLLIVGSLMAVLALPEAITGQPFTHNIASFITGNSFEYRSEVRFGVWRSFGPTDHPIVLGTICASALPIGFALFHRKRIFAGMTSLSFLGVLASASSAPLLSVIAQLSLYCWAALTRGVKYKWWILIFTIVFFYILVDVASNRDPLKVMFSYLLFNEHNGYVRYNMWTNSFFLAGQSITSFLVGYGFSTDMMSLLENMFWTRLMSRSVDSYWMVILLRYGAPMLFMSSLLVVLILRQNLKSYRAHKLKKQRTLIQAWFITAISLSLAACTVHFWGSTASLFFIVLGASAMGKKKSARKVDVTANIQLHERNAIVNESFLPVQGK